VCRVKINHPLSGDGERRRCEAARGCHGAGV